MNPDSRRKACESTIDLKRRIVQTADGSLTIQLPGLQEQYHSMHGALQEALHVFIGQGLDAYRNCKVHLLEMGFGTGLNALLTLLEAPARSLHIHYTGIEAYPVEEDEWPRLGYGELFQDPQATAYFERLHREPWQTPAKISPWFELTKLRQDVRDLDHYQAYDLIYFDAFGARVHPELWSEAIFLKMYRCLRPGGRLVTYAAKGSVRRAMLSAGFRVERLPGPPGKREMLRATREA